MRDEVHEVDARDRVIELDTAPKPDVGAPLPHVVCDEHHIVLAYLMSQPDPDWDGAYATEVGPDSGDQLVALVRFARPYAHVLGPPNDEAFEGHPLADRGLHPYAVFEVQQSSWIRRLERMNAVHPSHSKDWFLAHRRHFVFAFHDSVFECVAERFTVEVARGSMRALLAKMCELLR